MKPVDRRFGFLSSVIHLRYVWTKSLLLLSVWHVFKFLSLSYFKKSSEYVCSFYIVPHHRNMKHYNFVETRSQRSLNNISHYHQGRWWWPGDSRNQYVSSHDIGTDLVSNVSQISDVIGCTSKYTSTPSLIWNYKYAINSLVPESCNSIFKYVIFKHPVVSDISKIVPAKLHPAKC